MKRLIYSIILTLVLVSCGSRSGCFSFEGRLLNLNQGEFYVYSPDGVFSGIDTIKVDGGRFTYETPCEEKGTVVIVFPNFSELPIFAETGKSVTVKGDASHLREVEVKGTDDNELMTAFRQQLIKASPPEIIGYAEKFIRNNPETVVGEYVLRKYFVTSADADLDKTYELVQIVHKAQPRNGNVARMLRYVKQKKSMSHGADLPSFSAKDINGKNVTAADLRGKVAVVYSWASWNYDSRSMRDKLNSMKREYGDKLVLMGINLDASRSTCKKTLFMDSISSITVCDQLMFDSPLMETFAFGGVSNNVMFNARGKVVERDLNISELDAKLKTLLN